MGCVQALRYAGLRAPTLMKLEYVALAGSLIAIVISELALLKVKKLRRVDPFAWSITPLLKHKSPRPRFFVALHPSGAEVYKGDDLEKAKAVFSGHMTGSGESVVFYVDGVAHSRRYG